MNTLLACLLAFVNPIVDMDMSDPDCSSADGTNFYLTVSSFTDMPGLPIYHSTNLVNWRLVSHALEACPDGCFWTRRGQGVWAPSIRYHAGRWHIFWGDPDFGIFTISADRPEGPWSKPERVMQGRGLIDPCPLWDDDGILHLVNAFAESRAGFNSVIAIDGRIVYDGIPGGNHTVEGPKLYRHGGYYWIFAPAGGVAGGWQLALRSKNLYGPYESRVVLAQGRTEMNGPHQGAWVRKADGTDWFLHFQDKGYLGRVLCLQPMAWTDDGWPVIGNGGEPVGAYGDETNATATTNLLDWASKGSVYDFCGKRRLYSGASHVAKFPAPSFVAKAKVSATAKAEDSVASAKSAFFKRVVSASVKSEDPAAGLLLAGDRDVLFGLSLEARENRFALVLKDGKEVVRIGALPASKIDAGALAAWRSRDVEMEVRIKPCADDPRCCEAVFSCAGFESRPVRLANSIWQGVRIGVCAEPAEAGPCDWLDLESFQFLPFPQGPEA